MALVAAAAGLACAQPSSPPGGEQDRVPPRVLSIYPAPFDTVTDLRAPVRIEFDERLSIRLQGVPDWESAVLVSPATGDVTVEQERRALEISVAGGWRPGLVYRIVVLPVFRDLFGNQRAEQVELVFTTGAPIPPTAVAGFIEDRITGAPVASARIEATRRLDSVVYLAVSDTGGFFSLRNIPAGAYDVRAWADQDRDRIMDFQEAQDTVVMPLATRDTVVLALSLLPMDTLPARLVRAEPVDSLRVRLHFDRYLALGPVEGSADLYLMPDSVPVAGGRLIHGTALDSLLARERAVADSIRAVQDSLRLLREDSVRRASGDTVPVSALDTVAVDTSAAAPARRPLPRPAGPRPSPGRRDVLARQGGPAGEPRPARELILVLTDPLRPETAYLVEARGVVTIRGVPGGGGVARFRTPAREAPPDQPTGPTLPDSVPPPPDSAGP